MVSRSVAKDLSWTTWESSARRLKSRIWTCAARAEPCHLGSTPSARGPRHSRAANTSIRSRERTSHRAGHRICFGARRRNGGARSRRVRGTGRHDAPRRSLARRAEPEDRSGTKGIGVGRTGDHRSGLGLNGPTTFRPLAHSDEPCTALQPSGPLRHPILITSGAQPCNCVTSPAYAPRFSAPA